MDQKVRFGIIGTGGFGRYHIGLMSNLSEVNVVALCDPDPAQIEQTRNAFPRFATASLFSSHEDLVSDPTVDAVLISSPHAFHARQVIDSFAAGKHVLVEKPLTNSVQDAREAILARDKSGKVGAISYQRHGMGQFQFLKETIESGRYGKVLSLNSHLTQQWLQFTKGTWRQNLEISGGGQINDSGSHMIDILLWATGLKAKKVSAMMDNRGSEVDIDSIVSIEFEGGAYGSLTIVGDACLWHERHHIWLERAALVLTDDTLTIIDDKGRHSVVSHWPQAVSPDANLVDAILRGAEVLAPFECGLRTIELTEAAWKSAAQGGIPVEVASL